LLAGAMALAGCATRMETPRLADADPQHGYYYNTERRSVNNAPDLMFVMALSGGGTRAAAFSYGVMEELARTQVPHENTRTMLNEVDGISSVSGGSFTATAYALYGDKIFTEFEHRFLKRDVQSVLLWQTLNPLNWPRLWSGIAGRSDLAADYYDKILFNKATFGDLPRADRPFVLVNATDVSNGARFEFTQTYFDLICGDLSRFPISRAVAASSAVPVVLSPITLDNHGGSCGVEQPAWMKNALSGDKGVPPRARYRAKELAAFGTHETRPYIHLVDGGVTDNLGLRSIMDGLLVTEATGVDTEKLDRVRRVAILLVNAEQRTKVDWDRKPNPPGILNLGVRSSSIPMAKYSYETIELLSEKIEHWKELADKHRGQTGTLEFYLIDVNFGNLPDPEERVYLQNLKTSFNLPDGDVDRLRKAAGELVRQSPEYQRLLADLAKDAKE
jgi:NTE family protein